MGRAVRTTAVAVVASVVVGLLAVSCQHPVAAAGWSTVPSPSKRLPVPSYLEAVSCVSATFCEAVGDFRHQESGNASDEMAQVWDGVKWSMQEVRDPPAGRLAGVSCVSTTWCIAVGATSDSSALPGYTVVERWDGSSWTRQTSPSPGPAGSTPTAELVAVSCASTAACIAVGDYVDNAQNVRVLIERYDGSTWTLSGADLPQTDRDLTGVSCVSATLCIAVGASTTGNGNLSLMWDGSTWAAVPMPSQGASDIIRGVSCATATWCFAVGDYVTVDRLTAQTWTLSWDGSVWSIVPSPGVDKADNALGGVSCTSATSCVATGATSDPFIHSSATLVEQWNGSSWSITPSQNPGAHTNVLQAVSCAASGLCPGVGYFDDPSTGAGTLVESSSGSAYAVVASPDALVEELNWLTAVSCTSAWSCTAAGTYEDYFSGNLHALIESWNGTEWMIANNSDAPAHDRTLKGISCIGTGFCATVGEDESKPGTFSSSMTFIEMESGGTWSDVSSPNGGTAGNLLSGVSCTSTTSCTAVGSYVNAAGTTQTLVEEWDGNAWSIVPSPSPDAGDSLQAVACVSTTSCVAVGSVDETWNGSAWTVVPGPSDLVSVACPATNQCLGVGTATTSSGATQPVAAAWNGSTWSDAATSTITPSNTTLFSVSCSSTTACTAVGDYGTGSLYTYTAVEDWNGASWSQQTSPSPGVGPGAVEGDALFGASCVTGAPCMAVGNQNDHGWLQTLVEASGPTPPPPPPTPPTVSSVSPSGGSSLGGVPVTIAGSGFTGAASVDFASDPAESFDVVSDTLIKAVSPVLNAGTVDVTVTTPNGTSTPCGCSTDEFAATAPSYPTQDVVSTKQYALTNSDGSTWWPLACGGATTCSSAGAGGALSTTLKPNTDGVAMLTVNADLWTQNSGYNQDIGIFVNGALVAWKESGGFAGTFSPNAAALQTAYPVNAGGTYTVDVRWKTNVAATGGVTIQAGAGPLDGVFSPSRLTAVLEPAAAAGATAMSTNQYTLTGSDGKTWAPMACTQGSTSCSTSGFGTLSETLTPSSDGAVLLGFNADLWTDTAGYNQDVAIFVNGAMVGWKESGGFAGTFSPNAAFLQVRYPVSAGQTYTVDVRWKANKPDSGTISAGAGPIDGAYSPSILTTQLFPAGSNPFSVTRTLQYTLRDSDGKAWEPIACGAPTTCGSVVYGYPLEFVVQPKQNCSVVLTGNADLWTDTAGYNQDLGIAINGRVVAWKESGGFAGTFSPNAASVHAVQTLTAGTIYTIDLDWKANVAASGVGIHAGAGPIDGVYSPTSLSADFTSCS